MSAIYGRFAWMWVCDIHEFLLFNLEFLTKNGIARDLRSTNLAFKGGENKMIFSLKCSDEVRVSCGDFNFVIQFLFMGF